MGGNGIVVIDDYFPRIETGFRIAEFGALLSRGVVSEVQSSVDRLAEAGAGFAAAWPAVADRVVPFQPGRLGEFDLAYVLFLNNAMSFLPALRAAGLPFVLTLYPGGGFELGTPRTTERLDELYASGLLRHVITTQPRTTDHLAERFGGALPVTEVLGVTVSAEYLQPGAGQRTDYYGSGKATLDVCFVAYKYSATGEDKGYPVFLDTLRALVAAGLPVRGHVVGGFGPDDLPTDDLAGVLDFGPPLDSAGLRDFYLGMDVIISPNRPGVLGTGAFDGFPTGSVIEAALSGVAMLCSDELDQNRLFRPGRSILIERPDADALSARLRRLCAEPGGIARVAQAGLAAARASYSAAAQLGPRERVLRAELDAVRASG